MTYSIHARRRASFTFLLLVLGSTGCGDGGDDPGVARKEDDGGASTGTNGDGGEVDVCAFVPAEAAGKLLDVSVKAQTSVIPSTCEYTTGEVGAPIVNLQLRIHDGLHVGGTQEDAETYVKTVRAGAGLPPDGKVLLPPTDFADLDGGFWRAYGYTADATLESSALLELWLQKGDDLVLVQRFYSSKEADTAAQMADRLKGLALLLATKL